jgi:hypothetical protein
MDLKIPVRVRFGTRNQYNAWKASGGQLLEAELATITEEHNLMLGLANGEYEEFISKSAVLQLINTAIPVSKQEIIARLTVGNNKLLFDGVELGSSSGGGTGGLI